MKKRRISLALKMNLLIIAIILSVSVLLLLISNVAYRGAVFAPFPKHLEAAKIPSEVFNRDPLRTRRLLLHKNEIRKLFGQVQQKGVTIVPLKVYFSGQYVKVLIGVARGKKLYDKRRDIAKKDMKREAAREFKIRNID